MTNYIEEMMMTAGVNPEPIYSEVWADEQVGVYYPDFTAEKQIEIIKLIGSIHIESDALKCQPHTYIDYALDRVCGIDTTYTEYLYEVDYNKDKLFEQALAQLTTELMNAGELYKEKVKEILE